MAQGRSLTAYRDLKLDCGHQVKTGEDFLVTKTYSCFRCALEEEKREIERIRNEKK